MPEAPEGKCWCGCGGDTGSRFVPGHDMKLKTRLLPRAREGDIEALTEVAALGWTYMIDPSVPRPVKTRARTTPRLAQRTRNGVPIDPQRVKEIVKREAITARMQEERRRRQAEQRANHDRVQVMRELEAFGNSLCEICSHWRDSHVDGVCLDCQGDSLAFHSATHDCRTLLDEARDFFRVDPQDIAS